MRWEVTLRRKHGRRVARNEPCESAVGDLTIDLLATRLGHRPRAAKLLTLRKDVRGMRIDVLPLLLDPRLIYLRANVMVLAGIEVFHESSRGPVHEHVQIWHCRLLSQEELPPEPPVFVPGGMAPRS